MTAVSLGNAYADLRVLNIFGIRRGDVLLHFPVGTALGSNRRLQEWQRRDIASGIDFDLRAEICLSKDAHIQYVTRAEQIVANALAVDRGPGRTKDRTLGLLLGDRGQTERETYEDRGENQALNSHGFCLTQNQMEANSTKTRFICYGFAGLPRA